MPSLRGFALATDDGVEEAYGFPGDGTQGHEVHDPSLACNPEPETVEDEDEGTTETYGRPRTMREALEDPAVTSLRRLVVEAGEKRLLTNREPVEERASQPLQSPRASLRSATSLPDRPCRSARCASPSASPVTMRREMGAGHFSVSCGHTRRNICPDRGFVASLSSFSKERPTETHPLSPR